MVDHRPDPDALLGWVQSQQERSGPRLKIFFGYAPGVGKTYAMLESARRLRRDGRDVVAGCVVTHGRAETAELLEGLESLPARQLEHRGTRLEEFDLDAALARRPEILLLDELAHTNAPGSAHPKRWHDVLDLLDAGIEVHTTLNVQHVDSLNHVIAQITGVRVRETVPDALLERADELELVDLSPDELLVRLREGRVYVPEQAQRALEQFFRRGNLLALRELTLRRAAERVDQDMEAWRRERNIQATWPATERVLACVGPAPSSAQVVRAARRLASRLGAPWYAVYAGETDSLSPGDLSRTRLEDHLALAESLGAEVSRLSGVHSGAEILRFARSRNVTRIVLGRPGGSRILRSPLRELIRGAGEIELHLIPAESARTGNVGWQRAQQGARRLLRLVLFALPLVHPEKIDLRGVGRTLLILAAATLLGLAGGSWLALPDVALIYLFAVVLCAILFGRGASLAASLLAVAGYNYFFIPPVHTFHIDSSRHLLTFSVLFATGILGSLLVERLRRREQDAVAREERTAAFYALSRDLAGVTEVGRCAQVMARHAAECFGGQAVVLMANAAGQLEPLGRSAEDLSLSEQEEGLADWTHQHGRPAGSGTDTLPGLPCLCHPLRRGERVFAVLLLRQGAWDSLDREGRRFLAAWVRQAGLLLERALLAQEAREAGVRAQTEELRSSLLSAVSHDLRTPLAVITAAATTLRENGGRLEPATGRELLETICGESLRMERLVGNLLDMMRLESGGLVPKREWAALEEILGSVLDRLDARLAGRQLDRQVPEDLPLIQVDPVLVEQVLWNLLDNACRYTPAGSPLEIQARSRGDALEISVLDRGPGLPTDQPARVFDKFWRGVSQPGGTGLGLSICRGIVQAHGGTLRAANRPGGGAEFTLTLPVGEPPAGAAQDEQEEESA
ncbi:MAG: sensor histidine kinase KdpD [Candidatus Delongbacteria bacterium]